MQFEDFQPYVLTAQLAPYLPPPFKGRDLIPTIVLFNWVRRNSFGNGIEETQSDPGRDRKITPGEGAGARFEQLDSH